MKKILFILLGTLSLLFALHAVTTDKIDANPNESYAALWKKVESLDEKQQSRSALEVVKVILQKADMEKNQVQKIKGLIYKLKLETIFEEAVFTESLTALEQEAQKATFPVKNILHSMLGEIYCNYYQNNQWTYLQRTQVLNNTSVDPLTWDLHHILRVIKHHEQKSLENPSGLQKEALNSYQEILQLQEGSQSLRPTLFDFLAHRALEIYKNSLSSINQVADQYVLKQTWHYSSAKDFAKESFPKDSSFTAQALGLYQALVGFHVQDAQKQALLDVDLARLQWIHQESLLPGKDKLYLQALQAMEKEYQGIPEGTRISYLMAQAFQQQASQFNKQDTASFKYRNDFLQALKICSDAIARFPKSQGAQNCQALQEQITSPQLSIETESVLLPNQKSLVHLNYKNIDQIYFRVLKLNFDTYRDKIDGINTPQIIDFLKSQEPVKSWSLLLSSPDDYQAYSIEAPMDALEKGFYVLLISSNKDFSYQGENVAYADFWVSHLSSINQNSLDQIHILHRQTGKPLANVHVDLYQQDYDHRYHLNFKAQYISNDEGLVKIPKSRDYNSYSYRLKTKDDDLFIGNYYSEHERPLPESYQHTALFTDRSIYRPGQTIYFKGICLKSQGQKHEIVPNKKAKVSLYDVNHQVVNSLDLKTNEYGSYQGSFILPMGLLNGQMHVQDENGSQVYFSVEEYKRPAFQVEFLAVKESFQLGQEVSMQVEAKSYAGAALDGAKIKYRVVRSASFQPYYHRYCFLPPAPDTEIASGEGLCDEKGQYRVAFKALADEGIDAKLNPQFTYRVLADVTDVNGETQSGEGSLRVGYQSWELDVTLPENLLQDEKQNLQITCRNLQGEKQAAQVELRIYPLDMPKQAYLDRYWENADRMAMSQENFQKEFPWFTWDNENDETHWKKLNPVLQQNIESRKDSVLELLTLRTWKPGRYLIEAKTKDPFGQEVKTLQYFTVFSALAKAEIPTPDLLWSYPTKTSLQPKQKAEVLLGSSFENTPLYYIWHQENQVLSQGSLLLKKQMQNLSFNVEEKHRGGLYLTIYAVVNNRYVEKSISFQVPYSNKELSLSVQSWRNKALPGAKEEISMTIQGHKGEKVGAELLAAMYDASLDALKPHAWNLSLYHAAFSNFTQQALGFGAEQGQQYRLSNTRYYNQGFYQGYDGLNWFNVNFWMLTSQNRGGGRMFYSANVRGMALEATESDASVQSAGMEMAPTPKKAKNKSNAEQGEVDEQANLQVKRKDSDDKLTKDPTKAPAPSIRKNFNETAFFFPQLKTDSAGHVTFSYTLPESLTSWKFMALAHTQELAIGSYQNSLITQKPLMVVPNLPRFFREGDLMTLAVKINNLSGEIQEGTADIEFFNPYTHQILQEICLQNSKVFKAEKGQNALVHFEVNFPQNYAIVGVRIKAQSGQVSDGEEHIIPVLSNRTLVTESMPMALRPKQTKDFSFTKLLQNHSNSLQHHTYTVEFTSNPLWYVVQSLPYMAEYPYECNEQIFTRYYANSLASHIVAQKPQIKTVMDIWAKTDPSAFLSNLEKNPSLKSAILEETPWVLEAQDQRERKKRVALLFDLNKLAQEQAQNLKKLKENQLPSGAWPWFKGMYESRYITQYLVTGLGHLQKLGVAQADGEMIRKAMEYLDQELEEDYRNLKKYQTDLQAVHPSYEQIQYFYARSFFKDLALSPNTQKAYDYYYGQMKKHWTAFSPYMQGMIALCLNRSNDQVLAKDILKALKENAVQSDELGMYYKANEGYYWHQAPIEAQALLIEAFDEITQDAQAVGELQIWLLKNKQTSDWKTTRATAEACYALLLRGEDALASTQLASVKVGGQEISQDKGLEAQAGTGYISKAYSATEVKPNLGSIQVQNPNQNIAWGAAYWQYFEDLDKITPHQTPIEIKRALFLLENSKQGPTLQAISPEKPLKVGDKVKVRIEVKLDRDMEFLHLKDHRASALEPIEALSGYRYQDGAGYYMAIKDASMNFFFDYLKKGTYVLEYELKVSQKGSFSNGICNLQCMYAPEFGAHSEGIRIEVK